MDEKKVLADLNLPRSTHVLRTFPFNKLEAQLTLAERKVFTEVVEARGIRLLATLNPRTTNIPAFVDEAEAYEEIHIFKIKVKKLTRAERVYKIIAEVMPYPLIVMFEAEEHVKWVAANHRRIAKTGLLKMEKVFVTNPSVASEHYFQKWAFDASNAYNLKTYYTHFIEQMVQVELQEHYQVKSEATNNAEQLEEIKALEKQIADYVNKARREVQMNKRIEWQMKANKLKARLATIIEGEIE